MRVEFNFYATLRDAVGERPIRRRFPKAALSAGRRAVTEVTDGGDKSVPSTGIGGEGPPRR